MASIVASNVPLDIAAMSKIGPLPFTLDLVCPITLPARPIQTHQWPFPLAGSSSANDETAGVFVRRRYLETLFLPDFLAPVHHLVEDLLRITPPTSLPESAQAIMMFLPEVQTRHRKIIAPILTAAVAASSSPTSRVSAEAVTEALRVSILTQDEKAAILVAVGLRMGSRAVDDGKPITAREICDELEKRETLIQTAFLFLYILFAPPVESKRRKREKKSSKSPNVLDDPAASLEVFIDRLSVWVAVAELGNGPNTQEDAVQSMLKAFWDRVIKPFFLPKLPDQCAAFHLKVFAKPISPSLNPNTDAVPIKKPRKPTMTRARPSTDTLTQLPQPPRPPSAPPSEAGSAHSDNRDRSFSRSLSVRDPTVPNMRRERSKSSDPAGRVVERYTQERAVVRAPSGKDLFKDRQMTFTRRISHLSKKKDQQGTSLARSQSQAKIGLLGRKASDPKPRRSSEGKSLGESPLMTVGQSQSQQGTLVFATPSKPRLASSAFGHALQFVAPTPIREEPTSLERPAYIAETPHNTRIARDDPQAVFGAAETPVATRIPSSNLGSLNSKAGVEGSDNEDDPLGELMVMTDDEDENNHTQH